MMTTVSAKHRPHVLVFPFPSPGHLIPLLPLATCLASSDNNILVTLLHSPPNFAILHNAHNPLEPPFSLFRNQLFPCYGGGQKEEEEEEEEEQQQQQRTPDQVFSSTKQVELQFQQLIEGLGNEGFPVTCIICDSFMPWTQDVANKLGIPRVEFWTSSAAGYCIGCYLPQLVDRGYLPFTPETKNAIIDLVPGLSPFSVTDLAKDVLVDDLSNSLFQFLVSAFSRAKEAERVLVNTFYDLESNVVDAMRAERISIHPIGPLMAWDGDDASFFGGDKECLKWLDSQENSSVIYVSFGSYVSLTSKEMEELALGLEACRQPFLWVIRSDTVNRSIPDILPDGFLSRVEDRSCIVSWAPQLAVLSHRSIVGFLTHCGWNSILESLWTGVPMIGYPKVAEQHTNLKLIIDWKVGLKLEGQDNGCLTRESVETTIMVLTEGEEGKTAKRRAMELREGARKAAGRGGDSKQGLHRFVEDVTQMAASRINGFSRDVWIT